jgi:hypothetical protein
VEGIVSTASKTTQCLNSAFLADPNAIHALICNRVPCNQSLADHPNVVVDTAVVLEGQFWQASMLGVLNGVLTANSLPRVATAWSDERDECDRRKFVGFVDYPEDVQNSQQDHSHETSCSICFNPDGTLHSIVDVIGRCDSCRDNELRAEAEKLGKNMAVSQAEAYCKAITESSSNYGNLPSIEDLWEIYSHLQLLRSEEASQVTFTCANPEPEDAHEEVVEVKDLWTEWCGKDFRGATLLECLRKAVEARKAWYAEQEAKKIKLPWKT